jgi:pimeloyl-ACP methyl ester carboxylesterase
MAGDCNNEALAGAKRAGTLQIAQYRLPCHVTSLGISRMPATPSGGRPLALFLPGMTTLMNATCLRAIPLTVLFDLIVCELPGHGMSGEVEDVSLEGFAREYAALIDRYVPAPQHLWIIGESFGGLVAAALARQRPDRIGGLVLLETPVCLTRPALAQLLSRQWRNDRLAYHRRIYRQVFGFDPQDVSRGEVTQFHPIFKGLQGHCAVLTGSEAYSVEALNECRPASQLTDADVSALRSIKGINVLPRIESAGHCLLLDDPWACVAALERHLAG